MSALADPSIPLDDLIALRQIASCLHSGILTQAEAASAISRISPKFADCFVDVATAAAFIEIIKAILQARSPAACRLSRSERFRLKAAECLQLADNAVNAQPQEIYTDLARCYERLATHAEAIERHRYEKLLNRFPLKR